MIRVFLPPFPLGCYCKATRRKSSKNQRQILWSQDMVSLEQQDVKTGKRMPWGVELGPRGLGLPSRVPKPRAWECSVGILEVGVQTQGVGRAGSSCRLWGRPRPRPVSLVEVAVLQVPRLAATSPSSQTLSACSPALCLCAFMCPCFWPYSMACGILVPQPGIRPTPPAAEAPSLNRRSAREGPMWPPSMDLNLLARAPHLNLEEGMAICSSVLAWRLPGTEEPGGLQSMGS